MSKCYQSAGNQAVPRGSDHVKPVLSSAGSALLGLASFSRGFFCLKIMFAGKFQVCYLSISLTTPLSKKDQVTGTRTYLQNPRQLK